MIAVLPLGPIARPVTADDPPVGSRVQILDAGPLRMSSDSWFTAERAKDGWREWCGDMRPMSFHASTRLYWAPLPVLPEEAKP